MAYSTKLRSEWVPGPGFVPLRDTTADRQARDDKERSSFSSWSEVAREASVRGARAGDMIEVGFGALPDGLDAIGFDDGF